jgi:hypothetical protein
MVWSMRQARPDDVPSVAKVIEARSVWMEHRGLPSWRDAIDDLAGQAAAPDTGMWVLTRAEQIVGCTTLATDRPLWGWSRDEADQDAYYLFTTCTHPAWREARPGSLIAWWAVDMAAVEGKQFVRRGCLHPGLVRYYHSQGFELCHEVRRKNAPVYLMARRAQRLPEAAGILTAGPAVSMP